MQVERTEAATSLAPGAVIGVQWCRSNDHRIGRGARVWQRTDLGARTVNSKRQRFIRSSTTTVSM